jgi:hypothetical protein
MKMSLFTTIIRVAHRRLSNISILHIFVADLVWSITQLPILSCTVSYYELMDKEYGYIYTMEMIIMYMNVVLTICIILAMYKYSQQFYALSVSF